VLFTDDEEIHGESKLVISGPQQRQTTVNKQTTVMSNTNDSKNPNARARGNKNATVTAGQNLAEQMSSGDWDRRFEQLFDLFLIDVDSEFYDEKLPFDEPKDLEEKFETLETQNLFYISRLQDMEE
jgi:hypothetical protein